MAETKLDSKSNPAGVERAGPKDLLALQKALAEGHLLAGPNAVEETLAHTALRTQDQRQEQQLYASTWGGTAGIIAALIKVTDAERDISRRKALEAMQAEMFELLAKEKKKDALRNSPFFRQLVSILGNDTAESITQKLEAAGAASGSGLQANQAALTQASKDIAALLDKNQAILGLQVSGEALSSVLQGEITSAIALIPKPTSHLAVVKPEEVLATKAHDLMKGLDRGDERLARFQALRTELGPEKFTAMVDAYDTKYGIPLVAHIANLSSSNPTFQAEMMRETLVLLSLPQQERLADFGRAEYAQAMAVLDKRREIAKDTIREITEDMRRSEKVLCEVIGRPELANLPERALRGEVLEDLTKRFPQLAGKNWEEVYVRLKEVAGQSDPAGLQEQLRTLLGGKEPHDGEALRDLIARATLQMQKLTALEQQIEPLNKLLSTGETSDEARLRNHYSLAYGADATKHDAAYESIRKVAGAHIDDLHRRIADPTLSSEARAALIRERDTLEFSSVKKLAYQALHGGEVPDAGTAMAILKNFAVAYGDTPARRSEAFRSVCDHLISAIESANTLRNEWTGLNLSEFGNVEFTKPASREVISCIGKPPVKMEEMRLRERFAELDAIKSGPFSSPSSNSSTEALEKFLATAAPPAAKAAPPSVKPGVPGSKVVELEVLKAQRDAARSTDFFGHILESATPYSSDPTPLSTLGAAGATPKGKAALDRISSATSTLDLASEKLLKELTALEAAPRSEFLSATTQRSLVGGLSTSICSKMGARDGAEGVAKVLRELDPVHDLPVDREVLDAVRRTVPADTEIGKAIASVSSTPSDPSAEYEAIKGRLDPTNALRLDLLVARESDAVAQGKPSIAGAIVGEVLNADGEKLFSSNRTAREHARLSRIERLLGALTDEEHQQFLRFFEASTQRSVGAALIGTLPADGSRKELLLRIAGSRSATVADLQRFYAEPVPQDRAARVSVLSRTLAADAKVPPPKIAEVRQVAQSYAYDYLNLRQGARLAMEQGDVKLVGEITEKMRVIEARMNGVITKTVASLDASYVARTGLRDQLNLLQEEIFQDEKEKVVPGRPDLRELAKETADLLRSSPPKTDAAFNRLRQRNLTEEESLYLRALYAREATKVSAELKQRPLTGNLQRDLEPINLSGGAHRIAEERERVSLLVKGGIVSLGEADKRSLAIAERERDEKRQLEVLANLRATGEYGRSKDTISGMKLTPAAAAYHKAVTDGDIKKAEATELSIKAKNGDVKAQEVAKFIKERTPEELEKVTKDHPTLAKDIAAATPFFTEEHVSQLLSRHAAERERAVEQAMLQSLSDPEGFAAWLDSEGSVDGKRQRLSRLEALIEKQPDAPVFQPGAGSKIVQYVQSRRSDLREIDAHLIKDIIASRLGEPRALTQANVDELMALRYQATSRLTTLDVIDAPRRAILTAARENLIGKRNYLFQAESDRDRRYISAGRYDDVIALSKSRIVEQNGLVRSMEGGLRDIESSRELVRYAFALMAKDTLAKLDRGLRPETTDHVTTLLMQRDQKIQYKVTDHARDEAWQALVTSTAKSIESFDRWATVGLGTAKIVTTVAAGIFFSPAAGLAVATAWNAGDKVYRATVCKESVSSLAKSFAFELAIDTAFAAISSIKTATVTLAGGKAVEGTAAQGLKVTKRLWEFKPFQSALTPHSLSRSLSQLNGRLAHASEVAEKTVTIASEKGAEKAGEAGIEKALVTKYFQKLAGKIPDEMSRSPWAVFSTGRPFQAPLPPSVPSHETKTPPPVAPKVDDDAAKKAKLAEDELRGSSGPKKATDPVEVPAEVKKVAPEPTAATTTPAAPAAPPVAAATTVDPKPTVDITLAINPMFLLEIERKLAASPNPEVQAAVDTIRDLMASPALSLEDGDQRLQELQAALLTWTPYPELADALGKILSGSNPFLAFLDAPTTTYRPPPSPPAPPAQPPPQPPKAPGGSPGGSGGGMPGPSLALTPTMQGDSNAARKGGELVQPVSQPQTQLSDVAIAAGVSRADLQSSTMHQAVQHASLHAAPHAATQATDRGMAEGDGRLMNLEVASGVRELALENGARRQATAKTIDASVELVDYDTNHRKLLADMERMESEKVEARRERKVEAEKSEADERSRQERVEAAGARREVEERVAAEKAERREVPETEEHIYESRMFLVKGKKGEVCSDANTAHGVENGSTTERLTKGSIHEVGMREDQQVALTHGDNQQLGHQQTDRAEGVESVHVARPADAEAPASSSRVKPVAFEAIEAEGAHGAVQRAPTDQRQVQGDEGAPAYHAERPTTAGESSALTAPETSTQAEEFTLENLHDVERDETISKAPRAAHGKKVNDAQMRAFLLQQLMDQHATKARREKILKALIALGISEVEYRKLLLKLGEMDAARLAEQVAARATIAQPIAMTTDAPAMRENADTVIEKPSAQPVQTRAQTTRAALYKRLKEEGGAPARK